MELIYTTILRAIKESLSGTHSEHNTVRAMRESLSETHLKHNTSRAIREILSELIESTIL